MCRRRRANVCFAFIGHTLRACVHVSVNVQQRKARAARLADLREMFTFSSHPGRRVRPTFWQNSGPSEAPGPLASLTCLKSGKGSERNGPIYS